jgi:hypothetical protein
MREIPLTKGYVALIDEDDYERVAAFKWTALVAKRKDRTVVYGYRREGWDQPKRRWTKMVYLHRFIVSAPLGVDVDHRDGNGLHCWSANLRMATRSQNLANNRRRVGKTGYRGVTIDSGSPIAQISSKRIGTYKTIEDAARAYDAAAIQKFGEFARLNFPHEHSHAAPTAGNTVNGKL